MRHRAVLCGAVLLTVAAAVPAQAQTVGSGGPQRAARQELQALATSLDRQVAAEKDGRARLRLQLSAAAVRERLDKGDFRPGDRFLVALARDSAPSVDTVQVRDSLLVLFGGLPELRVAGVLRSELEGLLQTHASRYLRNVTVRASILTRVQVSGPVARPGFYYASPDRPVSDLVMLAGGPGVGANLGNLRIRRGAVEVLGEKEGRRVIKDGRTLEQLDVQSGDEVVVGTARKINWGLVIQLAFVVSSLFFAALQFIQWYYSRQD